MDTLIYGFVYLVSSIILSQFAVLVVHMIERFKKKQFNWANYVAMAIIMMVLVIVYETLIEPFSESLTEFIISLF